MESDFINDYVNELKDLLSDFNKLEEKISLIYAHSFEKGMYKNCTTFEHCDHHIYTMKKLVSNLLIDIEEKEI